MTRSPQFLNILAAEADHLITVTVTMREETRTTFINELTNSCKSDSFGQMTKQWNDLRAQTIQEAVDNFLVPFGAKYVREWLREEVEEHLAKGCADELERVSVANTHSAALTLHFSVSTSSHILPPVRMLRRMLLLLWPYLGVTAIRRRIPSL
jgi:transcriptional accessory protein Tex/SPT6